MISMLEKSDALYVFSRSDCISHFSRPVLFDISFWLEIFIDFRLILTPFSLVFRIKMGIKMNADFRIDFLKTFDILLTPFGSIHAHFRVPWSHFGCKMEAKKPPLASHGPLFA